MQRRQSFNHLGAFAAAIALPGIGWGLGGCASSRPLKLGINTWIGYETLRLAQDFKWLPADVQLENLPDQQASAQALQSGDLDAACLTLDEVLRLRAKGIGLTVGLVFDVSAGSDVVMGNSRIQSLADLAGKRVGIEPGALGALMLGGMLKLAHLQKSDVTVVDLPSQQQLQAWQRNEVDAIVCYEPQATLLQRSGAHRIFDSRQLPDTIVDVLAVRLDRASAHRAALRLATHAHFQGMAHLKSNRQDALYRIAARQGISLDEVKVALGGVVMPTLEANRQYLSDRHGHLKTAAAATSRLMVEVGLLAQPDSMAHIGNASWLPGEDA